MIIAIVDDDPVRLRVLKRLFKETANRHLVYWFEGVDYGWEPNLRAETNIDLLLCHWRNRTWLEDSRVTSACLVSSKVKIAYSGGGVANLPVGWHGISRPLDGEDVLNIDEWTNIITWVDQGAAEDTIPSVLLYTRLNVVIALHILCQCLEIASALTPESVDSISSTAHLQVLEREVKQRSWWARGLALGKMDDRASRSKGFRDLHNRFESEGIKGDRLIMLTELCRQVLRRDEVHLEDVKKLKLYVETFF